MTTLKQRLRLAALRVVALGAVVVLLYGGLAWGLLPAEGISVESHIAGLSAGVAYSRWRHRRVSNDR